MINDTDSIPVLSQSRWLAVTVSLVLSWNTFHVRARDTACRCVNAYARARERTRARMPDSSLPSTISKCSVSMWKYAVTKERIFHFVIYRRFRSYSPWPFLNVPNALDHPALSHSLSFLGILCYFHKILSILLSLVYSFFLFFVVFFLFIFLIFCTQFCTP